jgi:hypothetical protein
VVCYGDICHHVIVLTLREKVRDWQYLQLASNSQHAKRWVDPIAPGSLRIYCKVV